MNKKINPEAKEENKEESKESIIIPSIPKIKKTIIRNHKNFKKIPSTNYIHNSTLKKMVFENFDDCKLILVFI